MRMKLFDDDSSSDDAEKLNKIEIDKEFVRRYEHNKKREDLQRLEELKKKGVVSAGSDSDESSEEDEEENLRVSKKMDFEFFDALVRVKNQDPILRNKEAKLFDSESENEIESGGGDGDGDGDEDNEVKEKGKVKSDSKKEKKKKPMYLKDVVSKHLIEEGPEFGDTEDDDDDDGGGGSDYNCNVDKKKVKSYSEEQEELRKAFLEAVEAADEEDEGELLRQRGKEDSEEEEEDVGMGKKINEYFGEDEKLDEDMKFLKDYFRNRMWVGAGGDKSGRVDDKELGLGISDDEEEIERQDDYEREYNFRFEESAGDRVMGHSRVVEGSVRKKTNARKLQRERKEERMAHTEFERKEELKHLKNVKKKEMREKLRKIREAAGVGDDGASFLDVDDLEEEFIPEEYDKKMKETFDEEYYEAEDIDPVFGSDGDEDGNELEKPDFDKEDELLGLPKGWDDANRSSDGFLSARERILKLKAESGVDKEHEEDEESEPEEGKRKKKRKRQPSEVDKAVRDQLMEEYYKLDYEDTIGDLKTRFKYRAVNPKKYGLTAEEILMLDDKDLNQYVSIKKLAPYREKEWKVPRIKRYQQKQRNKEILQGEASNVSKSYKKLRGNGEEPISVVSYAKSEKPQPKEFNDDTSNLSRRSKRRLRQAELKLSHSRLMAYGKIPSKPKSKKKS